MEKCEGFIIRKKLYGESDYILTIFTREMGKISGLAKYAKKSKKRFGGRLEPFLLLKIFIKRNTGKFNLINDVELIKSFQNIYEDLESFLISSFILEHIDILTPEYEPMEDLFELTITSFEKINRGESILPVLLSFQIRALGICGYEPDIGRVLKTDEGPESSVFSISGGGLKDKKVKIDNIDTFEFHNDIIVNPERMEIFLSRVAKNIKVLTKYTEYYAERKFKTSKFLEDLKI